MRRALILVPSAIIAAVLIAARPTSRHEIVFQVTAANGGPPIEFEAHALGPDLKPSADIERAVTPYAVRVPGDEAYVLFRQHSGSGLLEVTVRATPNASTQLTSQVSMVVVRDGRVGGTVVRPLGIHK